jgi:hypothetical protein
MISPPTTAPSERTGSAPTTRPAAVVAARPLRAGDEMVVESVIGQVSGRPIFADELLEPISDQLQRESERLSAAEFMQRARSIIHERLVQVVLNELFLAEAEASLTEQQKMGLLAFLKDLQEKNIAERGGTLFGAQQKIAREQEMTIEQFEEAQKNELLIRNLLYERIQPRVIVSWRDVQREYELRRSEFNAAAQVTLRRLTLNNAEQNELIEQVKSRMLAGNSFDSIVEDLSLQEYVSAVGGGEGKFTMTSANLGDLQVADAYKAALAKLKTEAGQTTEALEVRGDTLWLHVASIDQSAGRTLFDVQEQLIGELRARREEEERDKYVRTLFEKGIYDELDAMSRRVLAVAILRFGR